MEYKEKNKYNPKVNLSSRSKINQDILKEESINTPKNYYLRSVNIYKNPKGNRKEINNIINNDYDKFELLDKIKKAQNSSRKINLINIKKNNNSNIENKINEINIEKRDNEFHTIDLKGNEYNKISQKQKIINSEYENSINQRDKKISSNKSYLKKDNDTLYNTELNDNNSIFNQIISRFKKFNENYQKFIKHTTESNMFNYNLRAKSINKSIDITRNKNNNIIKKDEDIQNEKSQLIKVNHMKKAKINKNKINFVLNKSMNKNNYSKKKEIKRNKNRNENTKESNSKLNDILLKSNGFLLNKINNRRNIKNKYSKSKVKNIIHNKNNSTINYLNNKNKTINYIPIDFRINSEKRDIKTKRIFSKNKNKQHSEYTKLEMIHQPIKINMKNNLLTDKRKYNNKAESISNNKDNIYTKIDNNYNLKKIVKDKENIINEDLCPETIDAQQKNNNSFLYNTNSCINSIYLKEINSNSDYENTLSNTINQMQSTFTEKISNKIFKRNEKENFESKIKDNINREYIRINEEQKIKDSFENNNSFFEKNKNKRQKNIVQKMNLYVKPIKYKSKSKNENTRINFSKEELLYKKKNNMINLAITHLSKLNKPIEGNKIFNENKNNYIRHPILKKIYINEDDKKNLTIDISKTDRNIINENININQNIIIENNIDNYYIIEKKSSFARFKKFYNFYFKIPIKNVCFMQKIRIHKSKNINKKCNGYEKITNKGRNMNMDLIKNGKEDIREKIISNSYSKNINKLTIDNKYENKIIFHSSNNNPFIENKERNSRRRAITEEKFALGCSKLNKILSKNLEMNPIFNGLEIDALKSQIKINSTEIDNQKNELYNKNVIEKENGGSEKKYKINSSLQPISDNNNLIKNNNLYFEITENLDNIKISNAKNNLHNYKINDIDLSKTNRTEDNFYNIHPLKKSKNKKKSNSTNKIKMEKDNIENKNEFIIDKYVYEQINQDLDNYLKFLEKEQIENNEQSNIDINYSYNWKTIDDLMINGKTKLEDIIKIYIELCKNRNITKSNLSKFNKYIKTIIEYYISDFSRNQIEIIHLNMIELFKSIIGLNEKYSDIFLEILGNLLFILLRNKLYFMKDLNSFTEKEKEIQINIAKIVKYSILSSGKCLKQYHNDFKFTKLFNNNEIFVNYVTNEIPELNKKI